MTLPSHHTADVYYFTVRGPGEFPLEMITYDSVFPVTAEDTAKIVARYPSAAEPHKPYMDAIFTGVREVKLGCVKRGGPTIDRWKSFAWIVINQSEED